MEAIVSSPRFSVTSFLLTSNPTPHSEAKQTEMSEFGAEKGLLQGHARRQVAHALKTGNSGGFQQSIFKSQVREGGCRVCDHLMHNSLIGCC